MKPRSDTVKFLCSYDGRILPRPSDGELRYVGGFTRVLSVPRSISFSELMTKFEDLCGHSVSALRCQLPNEELDDVFVSIKSDVDLGSVIEVYDRASIASARELKIRAFLYSMKSVSVPVSPMSSATSSFKSSSAAASPREDRRCSLSSPAIRPNTAMVREYCKYDAVGMQFHQGHPRPPYFVPHHPCTLL